MEYLTDASESEKRKTFAPEQDGEESVLNWSELGRQTKEGWLFR